MKSSAIKKLVGLLYAVIIIALACLFFTNDFWLVDLRKTSVVIGVGIDGTDDGVRLTAQLAVPKATEDGGSVQFACVAGEGETVAAALRDVNSKTGFYPKLVFCKLIVLGESCLKGDIFSYLDYFYRNEYTGLTPRVAACKGAAADVFSVQLPFGDGATEAVDRLLSKEAQRAGVAVSVNLRDIGTARKSAGGASVMPYIERSGSGEEESGSDGGSGESSGSSGSGTSDDAVFSCGKTAYFADGYFKGLLDEEHTLALNLLKGDVRHVFISCGDEEKTTVLGLRACKGGIKATESKTYLSFSAVAQVQDETSYAFARQDSRVIPSVAEESPAVSDGALSAPQAHNNVILSEVEGSGVLGACSQPHRAFPPFGEGKVAGLPADRVGGYAFHRVAKKAVCKARRFGRSASVAEESPVTGDGAIPVSKSSSTSLASSEAITLGERTIKSLIEELFSISLQSSCDFLSIGSTLYRTSPSYLSEHSETYLSDLPVTVSVTLTPSG